MTFCQRCEREHQPRERPVRCATCSNMTLDVHRVCADCADDVYQAHQDEIGDLLMLRALQERDG